MSAHQPLSVDALIARARRETGLQEFETREFLPPLRKFIESVNQSLDQLHERGRVGIEDRIVRLLVNHLRMHADIIAHPQIRSEVLAPPAAIIGLPRTGSTKLQRLLAAGRGFQELLMWQAYNPAPFPGTGRGDPAPRVKAAVEFVDWMNESAPDSQRGHRVVVDSVEEESHLIEQLFATPTTISFVPAYSWCRYIERLDKSGMYAHLRTCLQYLQWQFPERRAQPWLLKYPANLGNESYISRVFPGVRYVVTHRDPFPVLASLVALIAATRKLHCRSEDRRVFSRWALDEFSSQMERHLAWRDAHPDAQALDVAFDDIVDDGMSVARRIHAFYGLDWTGAVEADIRGWLAENERQRDRLEYRLDDLGFTEAECRERFSDYYRRYGALFQRPAASSAEPRH